MRNTLKVLAWGIVGLTLTGALSYGAFAIAGNSLSKPSTPLKMVVPRLVASPAGARTPSPKASHNTPSRKPSPHATRTPSPPVYQPPATFSSAPRPTSSPSSHEREPHHGDD